MTKNNIPKELIKFLKSRNIKEVIAFVKWLFPNLKPAQNITYHQAYIVKLIAFSEKKRISISAFTRYGKSQFVAIAVAIYILINKNKKIKFIGPTDDQAGIIKNYMSELILSSRGDILLNLSEIEVKHKKDRIKAEASSRRMTFKNGCEYRVVTAYGKGFGAMGHGSDLVIMDEAAMISRESYAKIVRMLGDDPINSTLVELFNPWDRNTKAYEHSINPRFERIEIDYKIGLQENRITESFVEEMREDMSPMEFRVLYESKFPDEAEDSLHSLSSINKSENIDFGLKQETDKIIKKLRNKNKLKESEYKKLQKELKRYDFRISCDPADKGKDSTVLYWGIIKDKKYFEILGVYSENHSESMSVVAKIIKKAINFVPKEANGSIHIDKIGIGVGTESRLREIKNEKNLKNIKIVGCHYGERAIKKEEFINKKSENHFRCRDLFIDECISLKAISKSKDFITLKTELLAMKWDITSSQKKKIIDPDKSPDFNDSLVYFVWKDNKSLAYAFI